LANIGHGHAQAPTNTPSEALVRERLCLPKVPNKPWLLAWDRSDPKEGNSSQSTAKSKAISVAKVHVLQTEDEA